MITSISKCNEKSEAGECPTQGGFPLTLYGKGFGTHVNGKVLIGGRNCTVEDGNSNYGENEITCIVPPGEGIGRVQVYHAWKQSQESIDFFYDSPVVEAIWPAHGPTTGGKLVNIQGRNFGVSGPGVNFHLLGMNSSSCVVQVFDHDQITCTTPPGQGLVPISVRVAGQEDLNSGVKYDYMQPSVHSLSPLNGPTAGGYVLRIHGENFGVAGQVLVGEHECETLFYSHEFITCNAPVGTGANVSISILSGGRLTTSPNVTFSYDKPVLESLDPLKGPTKGGANLTIHGVNFGFGAFVPPVVEVGPYLCSSPYVEAEGKIQCTTPMGIGQAHRLLVTVDGQTSENSLEFSFEPPRILRVSPFPLLLEDQASLDGTDDLESAGPLVTITGENFGNEISDPGAPGLLVNFRRAYSTEQYPCLEPERQNDESVRCHSPHVPVGTYTVWLSVALQDTDLDDQTGSGLIVGCQNGNFGQPDEFCQECPQGARCLGYLDAIHHDPISLPGFGSINRRSEERRVGK
jgi:hypothetical protein